MSRQAKACGEANAGVDTRSEALQQGLGGWVTLLVRHGPDRVAVAVCHVTVVGPGVHSISQTYIFEFASRVRSKLSSLYILELMIQQCLLPIRMMV